MAASPRSGHTSLESVRHTNDDATSSKCAAVNLGYYEDPFVHLFAPHASRKSPIIHRGYYTRVCAVRSVLRQFVKHVQTSMNDTHMNVISLGAGFDTTYFYLKSRNEIPVTCSYVEVDFDETVRRKCKKIESRSEFVEVMDDPIYDTPDCIHSGSYHLIGSDLTRTAELRKQLLSCFVVSESSPKEADEYAPISSIPTLIICECVLAYISDADVRQLYKSLESWFPCSSLLIYDPMYLNDAFGKIMVENFRARGHFLLGFHECPDVAAHVQRLRECGYNGEVQAENMAQLSRKMLPDEERRLQFKVEMLDEMEEWTLIQSHYIIALAFTKEAVDRGLDQAVSLADVDIRKD